MKNNQIEIEKINSLLRERKVIENAVSESNGEFIELGQIWQVDCSNEDFPFVIILEELEADRAYNVAPVFRWTENAGPEDLFIPREFMGTSMVVSFELEFSIARSSLKTCKGKLNYREFSYILDARNSLNAGKIDNSYSFAWEYLDEYDKRYKYHEELAAEIESLQSVLVSEINSEEEPLSIPFPTEMIISFEAFIPEARFAASSMNLERKLTSQTWICKEPASEWLLTETEDGVSLAFELQEGSVSLFENAVMINSDGYELAEIKDGIAVLPLYKLMKGKQHYFTVKLADGKILKFSKKDK